MKQKSLFELPLKKHSLKITLPKKLYVFNHLKTEWNGNYRVESVDLVEIDRKDIQIPKNFKDNSELKLKIYESAFEAIAEGKGTTYHCPLNRTYKWIERADKFFNDNEIHTDRDLPKYILTYVEKAQNKKRTAPLNNYLVMK